MDILLIGSRGREHAMAIALKKDERVDDIFCIPGNGGLAGIAHCVKMSIDDHESILEFLDSNPNIKLTVVSPDETLAKGLTDKLMEKGHLAFGASALAAVMESNKTYSRNLCAKYNIPSPKYKIFDDYYKAKRYINSQSYPLVIKTNGRTAGKGIMFCRNIKEAENAMYDIMVAEMFGDAGKSIVIEEYIPGEMFTVMTFCDGKTILPMKAVNSYKRVFDNDMGMSTAGMGAVVPADVYSQEIQQKAMEHIFLPTMNALNQEGRPFKGVLSYHLILTDEQELKVVDFTVRFCDAESQVIIPLLETPLFDIFCAVIHQQLDEIELSWKDGTAVCVIMTSGGYPLEYSKNFKINIGEMDDDIMLYHAGTKLADGELRTSGGRVMGICSLGASKQECADKIYENITKISYESMHYRKDIARD